MTFSGALEFVGAASIILGLGFALRSYMLTRKKYYGEYLNRKRNGDAESD